MIAEAGLAALWLAAALSLLQLFLGVAALRQNQILPVREAHGEGDHAKHGGGASGHDEGNGEEGSGAEA
nr:hypothetical protein [Pseudomonadota bacterium]